MCECSSYFVVFFSPLRHKVTNFDEVRQFIQFFLLLSLVSKLRSHCLIQGLRFRAFGIIVTDFCFHYFLIREHTSVISVCLNLLSCVFWPSIWSILENVPCVLEKNVYSAVAGPSVLLVSLSSSWLLVLLKYPFPC